jgi:hypothetical protein
MYWASAKLAGIDEETRGRVVAESPARRRIPEAPQRAGGGFAEEPITLQDDTQAGLVRPFHQRLFVNPPQPQSSAAHATIPNSPSNARTCFGMFSQAAAFGASRIFRSDPH